MLRIALCDDDIAFLDQFAHVVAKAFENMGQLVEIYSFGDGESLINKVEKDKQIFDIVFLDVDMPNLNGFQVAKRLRELGNSSFLLFTTYLEHQSREGYLYDAFRYIFKSRLDSEVEEAVSAILSKLNLYAQDQCEVTLKCRHLGVLDNLSVKKADIIYLRAEKTRRITLKTLYSSHELLVRPLVDYIRLLDSPIFGLIMRCYVINFNHVQRTEGDDFIMTGGIRVPMGIKREARNASMEKYLAFLQERL